MLNRPSARLLFALCLQGFAIAQARDYNGTAARDFARYCAQNPAAAPCASATAPSGPTSIRVPPQTAQPGLEMQPRPGGRQAGLPGSPSQVYPGATEFPLFDQLMEEEEDTEFQTLIEEASGKKLQLFGYSLFSTAPTTFAPLDDVQVPAGYVIGPGDSIIVRAWGQVDIDATLPVDRKGQVYLPQVGPLNVAGLKYDDLGPYVKSAVGRVFRNFDVSVSLGELRSIQVFVLGYARRPGAYTVSSLSTLVNALFVSGGPSNRGSLRHVQLKRGNEVAAELDVYELLLKGDKSKDVALMPGDVIYIPAAGPRVAITGSINVPAIYELAGTTTLGEQVDSAGGLSNTADGLRVIVERIDDRSTRTIAEFGLDAAGRARELHDGDLVRVFSILPKFKNAVTLRGNVAEPGRYPFREGMRVRDLIPSPDFLLTRNYWKKQNATDMPSQEEPLPGDSEALPSPDPQAATKYPALANPLSDQQKQGNNRQPDEQNPQERQPRGQVELRNDVKLSAPEINWEYAVIQRLNPSRLSTELVSFNLGRAIFDGDPNENVELQPGDVITIFSQRDMAVPLEHQSKFVRLEGEFRAPGVYKVQKGETLRSVIARAGGLSPDAYIFGTQFLRESSRLEQQASLDRMIQELDTESQHQTLAAVNARSDQQANIDARSKGQRALVQKLREIKATGRVVLQFSADKAGTDAFPEIPLEDGDTILVPHVPSSVSVVGSVYNQSSFLFQRDSRVDDYLKLAGSGNREADMKHVFLVRADGSVISRKSRSSMWSGGLGSIRVLPGDTVVVPAQLDKGMGMRTFRDWSQLFTQFALGAAAINVLR